MSFVIFTDTSANLPTPEAEKYGIEVIPLSFSANGTAYESLDTEAFDYNAYYEGMKKGAAITTSQINPQKYIDHIAPVLEAGSDVLFVGMSAGISGSYNSMVSARVQLLEEFPERQIRLVDTKSASLGEGILVLEAQACKERGMGLDETADLLMQKREQMYQVFTVDDLMHLRKGGRLSNAAALLGTLLNIKPILKGDENGKIVSFEKIRGRKAVISRIAAKYEKLALEPEKQIVGISYCGCPEDAQVLAEKICAICQPRELKIVAHEPVTGSYLGPGALALYFMGDGDVRTK